MVEAQGYIIQFNKFWLQNHDLNCAFIFYGINSKILQFVDSFGNVVSNVILWHLNLILLVWLQARRSFRAIRGLVRLQGVMKGHSVKRQTVNALKSMQMLVRVQNQIHSRRIQMLENQVLQRQAMYKNDQDLESSFGKWMVSLYFS